ncbi:piggyBac transposable element-derived protein 4-like isoform X2 [Xyrauchen texanus]|uniref:piggyBac transposable element-derived protein 4-like isoform X2 n=1 Tax=Xyrauchen texanus TaxID=154827 RepID=UPI0022422A44|nr:piggyBac transposable element-derived protein 4-like isoform X2 [Xyrauchen texanus]
MTELRVLKGVFLKKIPPCTHLCSDRSARYPRVCLPLRFAMDSHTKRLTDTVEHNPEHCLYIIDEEHDESDEFSDLDSAASSVDSTETFIDDVDFGLDQCSNDDISFDEECNSETTPRKRQRTGLSTTSQSPAKSVISRSPSSLPVVQWRGKRRSVRRYIPGFSFTISEVKWQNGDKPDIEPPQPVFRPAGTPGPQVVTTASLSPLQFFELFFSTSVMQTIVNNTNAYGAKCRNGKKPWRDITIKEFRSYLALVIYMGLLKCSSLRDYWRTSNIFSLPYPARIMSSRKFHMISQSIHISDPKEDEENDKKKGTAEYDRLCRIKPLYQQIREACKDSFHPFQNISIDERMVAAKARNGLKQYMKNSPTQWGYKLFVLADSCCGYTWDFFVYEGKSNLERSKGISYDSVMTLANEKLLGTGYKLFVDNFYTSPTLFRDLLRKKIWACGTVRPNRMGHSEKPPPRGNIRWFRDDNLLFLEWKDKKEVLICSTFHKAYNGDTVKRKVKKNGAWVIKDFPVPAAVLDINKHRGGVDLSNMLLGYYTVLHKTMKWYQSFFYHFVDLAVVNAFILHQQMSKEKNQKPLVQKAFRELLVSELAGTGSASPASPIPSVSHMPTFISGDSTIGRRKCKICHRKTPVICVTCGAALCLVPKRECFVDWHESGSFE